MIPVTEKSSVTVAKYTKLFNDVFNEVPNPSKASFIAYVERDFKPDGYTGQSPNQKYANELIDDIISKYKYYEICDEDEQVFWQCMTDVFCEYVHLYNEYLTRYLKDKDIDTLFTRTSDRKDNTSRWGTEDGTTSASDSGLTSSSGTTSTTKEGSSEGTSSKEENTNRDTTHRDYDLPNHSVSSSSEDGYLTAKFTEGEDTQHEVNDSNYESHEDTESGSSTTSSEVSSSSSATLNTETSGGSEYDSNVSTTDPKDFYKVKKEIIDMIRNYIHEFADKFEDCFLHVF